MEAQIAAHTQGKLSAVLGLLLVVTVVTGIGGWSWWQNWKRQPVFVGEDSLHFEVPKGASMSWVANSLSELTGYSQPRLLSWYARNKNVAQHIQAGEYSIPSGTTVDGFLSMLNEGQVISYPLTLIEGWTVKQMMEYINDHQGITHTVSHIDEVMQALGYAGEPPEGRFFPDTYHVTKQHTDIDVLRIAYARMVDVLDQEWKQRASGLPLDTPYQALILASIIEKETGHTDERDQIAGVFVRRLQRGMKLQTDPTVIYGVGDAYQGDITRAHLATDTPYNTYTRFGLPPTPIALAGQEAIHAALNPSSGNSLYFVATGNGDGRHQFSETLVEHNAAVQRYLKRYRQRQKR